MSGLKNIAFMNVSKIAVDGYQSTKTRKNALEYAVFEDKAELRAQLESIAPDIVVCGNTGKYRIYSENTTIYRRASQRAAYTRYSRKRFRI